MRGITSQTWRSLVGISLFFPSSTGFAADGDGRVLPAGVTAAVDIQTSEFAELPAATQYLLFAYPGARATIADGRLVAFHGVPLTCGDTPAAAEQAFWQEHADAFGIPNLVLREVRSHSVGMGKFAVYAYHQTMEGLRVEETSARLVVRNVRSPNGGRADGAGPRGNRLREPLTGEAGARPRETAQPFVVLASGNFLEPPAGGLAEITVTPAEATALALGIPPFDEGAEAGPPELIVAVADAVPDEGWSDRSPRDSGLSDVYWEPRPAWLVPVLDTSGSRAVPYSVFIDAANGQVLRIRCDELNADVTGTVAGYGTPGLDPDTPTNPPTAFFPLEDLSVSIADAQPEEFAFSDVTGSFTIQHGESGAVDVESTLAEGLWYQIDNLHEDNEGNSDTLSESVTITPPGPAALVFNDETPTEYSTAQVNAYVSMMKSRRLFVDRTDWTGLNVQLRVAVNDENPCNGAFINPLYEEYLITLGVGGSTVCYNAAYSTIASHEHGHFIERQLGISRVDSIQEGFADVAALLTYDTDILGQNFLLPGPSHLRDYRPGQPARSKKYPCSANQYECGKVLVGLWCDIRANIIAEFGNPAAAKEYVSQLFVDWAQITNGGANKNAAHPLTMTEILIAADDDGDLSNGVPHILSLCSAGGAHKLALFAPPNNCASFSPTNAFHTAFWTPVNIRTSEPSGENPAGVNPHGVAVADIDGNGLKDVALACEGNATYSGSILVYWNITPPGVVDSVQFDSPTVLLMDLSDPPVVTRPAKIAIADMGSGPTDTAPDGRLDLVVTLRTSDKVRIYYRDSGAGARTFSTFAELTPVNGSTPVESPIGLAVGDWDGDGRNDIAVAGYVPAGVGGTLSRPVLAFFWGESSGYSTASIRIDPPNFEDEKGRGYDLTAWQDSPPSGLHRFAMTNFNPVPTAIPVHDLYVFRQSVNGSRSFTDPQTIGNFNISRGCTHVDVNGDGREDILATSATGTGLRWAAQLATGGFDASASTGPQTIGNGLEGISVGQLSKHTSYPPATDGYPDAVIGYDATSTSTGLSPDGPLVQHAGSTGGYTPTIDFFPLLLQPSGVACGKNSVVADVNGDGFADVVTSNFGTPANDAWEGFSVLLNRNY